MSVLHVGGVDPGLVHTGVVTMSFDDTARRIEVAHVAVAGLNEVEVRDFLNQHLVKRHHRFIEGYRPRSNLNSDKRMVEGVAKIKAVTNGVVLNNTGVKAVVKKSVMDLIGVWRFPTVTNHQDLRSAARIALLGMFKDPEMNTLIADIVRDHLNGSDWHVVQ